MNLRCPSKLIFEFSVVLQVKAAYINFLNHCYIDTEVEMKEIYTSNHMWTLFENFLVDMALVSTVVAQIFLYQSLQHLNGVVVRGSMSHGRGFTPWSGHSKNYYEIDTNCLPASHTSIRVRVWQYSLIL